MIVVGYPIRIPHYIQSCEVELMVSLFKQAAIIHLKIDLTAHIGTTSSRAGLHPAVRQLPTAFGFDRLEILVPTNGALKTLHVVIFSRSFSVRSRCSFVG
jgi:hypothetical protein